jgi:hypothetical protein
MDDPAPDSEPGTESATGTPRWVKVFGLLAVLILVLLVVIALLVGGHGPGRHTQSRHAGDDPLVLRVAVRGTQQP